MKVSMKILLELLHMMLIGYGFLTIVDRFCNKEEDIFLLGKILNSIPTIYVVIFYILLVNFLIFLDRLFQSYYKLTNI